MRWAVLADTGPLYAGVDPSDQHHRRAQREADRLAEEGRQVLLAQPLVAEAYSLILRRLSVPAAHRWLAEAVQSASLVTPTTEDYRAAIQTVHGFADQPLTLFDTVLAAIATRLDCPVWTYDHHFDVLRVPVWR